MAITPINRSLLLIYALAPASLAAMFAACTDSYRGPIETTGTGGTTTTATTAAGLGGEGGLFMDGGGGSCEPACSNDLKSVLDCHGGLLTACTVDEGCSNAKCIADPCKAAEESHSSYGCDYYALKTALRLQADGACFAAFVANTWGKAAHIKVDRGGLDLPTESFGYIPTVQGQMVTYTPYDAAAGLGVGQVAILFLSRLSVGGSVVNCPMPAAINQETGVIDTGIGTSFHITADVPVVVYQIVPYGGGQAGVTSATLLLPTSSWDTNYIAINAYSATPNLAKGFPSLDIVAYKDNTEVTILPKVDIVAGPGVEAATAGMSKKYTLNKGQFLQVTQEQELSGSPIQATEPIGVFGAATCVNIPSDQLDCDSAQQQLAPVKALGSEYAAVRYKDRTGGQDEAPPWRIVGAVDQTTLEWIPAKPPGAPKTINLGDVVEFKSAGPFVVKSQNSDHPFYL
ncbi:MAG: IgGFc-binding protein, partial [Minicystis sp.]